MVVIKACFCQGFNFLRKKLKFFFFRADNSGYFVVNLLRRKIGEGWKTFAKLDRMAAQDFTAKMQIIRIASKGPSFYRVQFSRQITPRNDRRQGNDKRMEDLFLFVRILDLKCVP